jgi:hypothetical protein
VLAVAGGTDFTGRGATDDLNVAEQAAHFPGKQVQVVFAGAEEDDQRHIRLRHRGVKLAHGV